jgi:hypothetical protein
MGVASGYGFDFDLGNKSGRWVWRAERIVVGLPGCKLYPFQPLNVDEAGIQ